MLTQSNLKQASTIIFDPSLVTVFPGNFPSLRFAQEEINASLFKLFVLQRKKPSKPEWRCR